MIANGGDHWISPILPVRGSFLQALGWGERSPEFQASEASADRSIFPWLPGLALPSQGRTSTSSSRKASEIQPLFLRVIQLFRCLRLRCYPVFWRKNIGLIVARFKGSVKRFFENQEPFLPFAQDECHLAGREVAWMKKVQTAGLPFCRFMRVFSCTGKPSRLCNRWQSIWHSSG